MKTRKYRRDKRGNAFVEWRGKRHPLGKHGSTESVKAYHRFLAAINEATPPPALKPGAVISIAEAAEQYLAVIRRWRNKRGGPSAERYHVKGMIRCLLAEHALTPLGEFGPKALRAVREKMVLTTIRRNGKETSKTWTRGYVNQQVGRIRRFFRWAVAEELIPSTIADALAALEPLRKNASLRNAPGTPIAREGTKVSPADENAIQAILAHCSPTLAAMVNVHSLTGMRPEELCAMRPRDLNRLGKLWEYRPAAHKTEDRGIERICLIGPRAQAAILPFLLRPDDAYLFSPSESVRWHNQQRWENRRRAKTKRAKTPRKVGERFTPGSYRQAIQAAARRAGILCFTPYQLRHLFATQVRELYDLEGAQVALGHARADVTQVYAEKSRKLARRIAEEMG